MIKSMTGYGRGEYFCNGRKFTVEIKAVNHRYGDITLKMPRILNPLEDRIRKRLAQDIQRGKVDVYIAFETCAAEDIQVRMDTALTDAYFTAFTQMKERYAPEEPVTLNLLATLPDIFVVEKQIGGEERLEALWQTLCGALEAALAPFNRMRAAEGRHLCDDLIGKRQNLSLLLEAVKARAPVATAENAARLRQRIQDALADATLDETRLLTEIAVQADRYCVDEEITRLESHIGQTGDILSQSYTETAGRKLDFILQEINREINTIGSKANDVQIARLVIDMKGEVEKIREQVQNIE